MHDCEMIGLCIYYHPQPTHGLSANAGSFAADGPIDYVCANLLYYCMCYYLGETLEVCFSLALFKRSYIKFWYTSADL